MYIYRYMIDHHQSEKLKILGVMYITTSTQKDGKKPRNIKT